MFGAYVWYVCFSLGTRSTTVVKIVERKKDDWQFVGSQLVKKNGLLRVGPRVSIFIGSNG